MANEWYHHLENNLNELINAAAEPVVDVIKGNILGDTDMQEYSSLVDTVHLMNAKLSQLTYTFGGGVVGDRKF